MLIHELKTYYNSLQLPIAILKTNRCEFASHWHYDFEAAFVLSGSVSVNLNGASERLHAGDALVCSGGDIHSYYDPSEDSQVTLLTLDPFAARKAGTLVLDTAVHSSIFRPDDSRPGTRFHTLLDSMVHEYTHLGEASTFFLYAYILEIQGILHRYYQKTEFDPGGTGRHRHLHSIRESISYIEEHYDRDISIAEMAQRALMSVSGYSREFKKITGVGYKDYVTLVRMREVEAILREENAGIADTAYRCGFGSVRTFNRLFREHYKMTPGEYFGRQQDAARQSGGIA